LDDGSWKDVIGLGVAGNFAGHLEQAGEASDFVGLEVDDPDAPKGVFPFYVPGTGDHFLHTYPISSECIRLGSDREKHQIEPEMALLCDLEYDGDRVVAVVPRRAMAHNDCSIRREGAKKISEKKNWGADTKGTAPVSIEIDRFSKGGILDHYRIASFLLRNGALHDYGVDSSAASYSYMYEKLLAWLVSKLNDQVDEGPLENISEWLAIAGRPARALISIGATRYTDFGETTFLERGDEIVVAVYDGSRLGLEDVRAIARGESAPPSEGLSLLRQRVA
jgi:hypothetical protein